MKSKFLTRDYREELASIAEGKGFSQIAENLLLSMTYKIEDSYENYYTVKREVPTQNEFIDLIIRSVRESCDSIDIIEPGSPLDKEYKKNKCRLLNENEVIKNGRRVISYPSEKDLLYGIKKVEIPPLSQNMRIEEQAILTAINVGKCISASELIRDFSGWTWSILEDEIENEECNIIYILLSFLLGHQYLDNVNIQMIERSISHQMFYHLKRVAMQFYMDYDKKKNDEMAKKIAETKQKLEKMKNQPEFFAQLEKKKKRKIYEINKIDEILNNPKEMKRQYLNYNNKVSDKFKIFSISHYEEKLQNKKEDLLEEIEECNRMEKPVEYAREKEKLHYEIKFYEEKSDVAKLQKEFVKCFEKKIIATNDRRMLLDMIYEIRYLNFLPKYRMRLTKLEEILIPKAIQYEVLSPISNNNTIDYRILKGIFRTQAVSLENLLIKLSSYENKIHVELYDGEILDSSYNVTLPEGSTVEIRRSKKMRIFG